MAVRKNQMGAPYSYHLERANDWVVQLYQAWGKPDKAVDWQQRAIAMNGAAKE